MQENQGRDEYYMPALGLSIADTVHVPQWLLNEIYMYFRSPGIHGWGWSFLEQIEFDIIIACTTHLASTEDFEYLISQLSKEPPLRQEMYEAIEKYAHMVEDTLVQRREEKREKALCAICATNQRLIDFDICSECRRKYWQEAQRIKIHLYRARKAGTPATLTLGQWIAALRRYNSLCAYCTTGPYEVLEHYVPISAGGGTTEENCIPACRSCNVKKSDEHPEK